jgi:hypothetical protein
MKKRKRSVKISDIPFEMLTHVLEHVNCVSNPSTTLVNKRWKFASKYACSCNESELLIKFFTSKNINHFKHWWEKLDRKFIKSPWFFEAILLLPLSFLTHALKCTNDDLESIDQYLLKRACEESRIDIVKHLINERKLNVTIDVILAACRRLDETLQEDCLEIVLESPMGGDTCLNNTQLINQILENNYDTSLRILLHWEPRFATPHNIKLILDYSIHWYYKELTLQVIGMRKFRIEWINDNHIDLFANMGWIKCLETILQHPSVISGDTVFNMSVAFETACVSGNDNMVELFIPYIQHVGNIPYCHLIRNNPDIALYLLEDTQKCDFTQTVVKIFNPILTAIHEHAWKIANILIDQTTVNIEDENDVIIGIKQIVNSSNSDNINQDGKHELLSKLIVNITSCNELFLIKLIQYVYNSNHKELKKTLTRMKCLINV